MWGFFNHIIQLYVQGAGVIDDMVSQASVPLINFMVKSPESFFQANQMLNNQVPIDLMFGFVHHIFQVGKNLEDEITCMCAVTLLMAMLEHLGEGVHHHIPTINNIYIQQLSDADTKDYQNMIVQGLMMNFFTNQEMTVQSLESMGQLDNVFQKIVDSVNNMDKDFEIKKLIVGLSTLAFTPTSNQTVQSRCKQFLEAIVFLCQKSLELKEKRSKPIEEAQVDQECEKNAIGLDDEDADEGVNFDEIEDEDDDDEWSHGSDDEFELYDSKFDQVDEILWVRDSMSNLQ